MLVTWSWATAWILYSIVFLIGSAPIWTGSGFPIWDANMQFAPTHMLLGDFLIKGRIFLWNPWINAGSPDFADPQARGLLPVQLVTLARERFDPSLRDHGIGLPLARETRDNLHALARNDEQARATFCERGLDGGRARTAG